MKGIYLISSSIWETSTELIKKHALSTCKTKCYEHFVEQKGSWRGSRCKTLTDVGKFNANKYFILRSIMNKIIARTIVQYLIRDKKSLLSTYQFGQSLITIK